jgi:Smr domain-containing protein
MKYQPGDKIIVLLTNEEGTVVEIIDKEMVLIEVKGVRFPAYQDQVDFPYFKMFTEKKIVPSPKKHIDDIPKEKNTGKEKLADGVWLAFLPVFDKDVFDDNIIKKLKLYLVNQTAIAYNFNYGLFYPDNNAFQLTNKVESLTDFYLHDIAFEDISNNPRFDFEFSLITPDKKKAAYYEVSLKLKAKQLFKKIEEMQAKNEASFRYTLFEKYPDFVKDDFYDMPVPGKAPVYDASKIKKPLEPARSVIDLHIEKLSDNWKHLSNFEILTIQLKTFEKFYDLAIAHYQPSLIVIHGIGIGKLRDEIHDILRTKKEVSSFVNQYHHNYGYGATEIFFSYK